MFGSVWKLCKDLEKFGYVRKGLDRFGRVLVRLDMF